MTRSYNLTSTKINLGASDAFCIWMRLKGHGFVEIRF